ncbi:MAG: inositol monophosphatase [Sulfitobacter sp.]|nr:inositol monophosphatase [Sulfitobacter sp.]
MEIEAVTAAIVAAAAQEIRPRFRQLEDAEVEEKAPGEVVTAADRACEAVLTELLREIKDAPAVGEEAASTNPDLMKSLEDSPVLWLVDPLDGTSNFADGSPDYSVMVAFLERGTATASWMWSPEHDLMAFAHRGEGAYLNGQRVLAPTPTGGPAELVGVVKDRFLPDDVKNTVRSNAHRFAPFATGWNCAGIDYPRLVEGAIDFLLYWRTLPWDHAPGVLFAQEAGCDALRPNSEPFKPDAARTGLVIAHSDACDMIRAELLTPR